MPFNPPLGSPASSLDTSPECPPQHLEAQFDSWVKFWEEAFGHKQKGFPGSPKSIGQL